MAFPDLQAFLTTLEQLGELQRVSAQVDPVLEIAEITARVCKDPHGKALLFERVKGSSIPVVTNMFGSPARMSVALGIEDLETLALRMEEQLCSAGADSPFLLQQFSPVAVSRGICQEIRETSADLNIFPFLKNWPGDGVPTSTGRFITLPLVVTRDPGTGAQNYGMYRVEVLNRTSAAIHWQPESGGHLNRLLHVEAGTKMPVAIVLGGDPALTFAAAAPLPVEADEMRLAGFIRRAPVELVPCLSNPLLVPASAEIVIEGFIEGMVQGGRFGNHTGFYVPGASVPVMNVTAISRRNGCVCPATVVGPPPMEDCWLAKGIERLFLPLLKQLHPAIADVVMPLEGIFHGCAVVKIRKSRPGEGKEVLRVLRASGMFAKSRLMVVVDEGTENMSTVFWRVLNTVSWSKDLSVYSGPDSRYAAGGLDIDGTKKLPEELDGLAQLVEITRDGRMATMVDERWAEYGI